MSEEHQVFETPPAWAALETEAGGTFHSKKSEALGAAVDDTIVISGFPTPCCLIGAGYAEVEFEEGKPRRNKLVTCQVPANTKHVVVIGTCAGFTYGSVTAPQEAKFCRMLHQVVKQNITGTSFKVDVRAFLQNKGEDIPWSGVIHLEILCFG